MDEMLDCWFVCHLDMTLYNMNFRIVILKNLSGYQTYIGPAFEKGQIRFCHDMRHYMWILSKRGEIGPWN